MTCTWKSRRVVAQLAVRPRVRAIFEYRKQILRERFGAG